MPYEKKILEKWIAQINSGEVSPEFLGLGNNKEKALNKLKSQINDLQKTECKSKQKPF